MITAAEEKDTGGTYAGICAWGELLMLFRIAVVDDDISNLRSIEKILKANGYKVTCLTSGEELLSYAETNKVDLVLLDVHMIGMDGFETIKELRMARYGRDVPVIFLAADDDKETETKALTFGAMDYVTKPIIDNVLLLRVRNTMTLIRLQNDLRSEVRRKTEEVYHEHEKYKRLSIQVVQTLAGAIDAKDNYTRGHSSRVAKYAMEIARRYGYSAKEQEEIYMMGLLHDVGKIGIPDTVINKPSRLTADEFDLIKKHPAVGFDILKNISELPNFAVGARWHHERYDGKGYPDGLAGTDIPEEARIIAVADAYDAMSSNRSYHDIFAQQYIRRELEEGKGTQFDPTFADIMLDMIEADKDYSMREMTFNPDHAAYDESANQLGDNKFSFLSMLETGGIDTAVGLKYCLNDVDFYLEMLNDFSTNSSDRKYNLCSSYKEKNWEKYRRYVHSLKRASMTIGAVSLSEKAMVLEEAARIGDEDLIATNHDELITSLKRIVGGILMSTATFNK